MNKIIAVICALMLLGACHHNSAQYQTREIASNSAGVYIYRINSSLGASASYDIFLDDRKLGTLVQASYLRTALQPGEHTVRLRDLDYKNIKSNKVYTFTVSPGEKQFVQVMWTPTGKQKRVSAHGFVDWLPHYGAKLVKANPNDARKALRDLSLAG